MDTFDEIQGESLGEVKISDEVMAICTINATLRTEGVSELSGGITDTLSKTLLGKESLSKGVKVSQTEEGLILDVFVIVDYGVKIPVVAWDVQTNVKKELETMTDRPVIAVNIHVQGVKAEELEEEKNQ